MVADDGRIRIFVPQLVQMSLPAGNNPAKYTPLTASKYERGLQSVERWPSG